MVVCDECLYGIVTIILMGGAPCFVRGMTVIESKKSWSEDQLSLVRPEASGHDRHTADITNGGLFLVAPVGIDCGI